MRTEIISRLHKTPAYENAVVELMLDFANDAVKKLELKETLPIAVPASTHRSVDSPADGFGGSIFTPNYLLSFHRGHFCSVSKERWLQQVSPPAQDMFDLARQPSLLDKEGAYQLAVKWLAALELDVPELELRFPPRVFQLHVSQTDAQGRRVRGSTNLQPSPLFIIGWGDGPVARWQASPTMPRQFQRREGPPDSTSPVYMRILGTTKELIELRIHEPSLFESVALQLPNASELLGRLPEPLHFVEQKFGGKEGFHIVAEPDKVEAWLLDSQFEGTARTEAVTVDSETAKALSSTLTDFDSFNWDDRIMNACLPKYGAALRFTCGIGAVEVLICFMCSMLHITHNGVHTGGGEFLACGALAKAVKKLFPNDEAVQRLRS